MKNSIERFLDSGALARNDRKNNTAFVGTFFGMFKRIISLLLIGGIIFTVSFFIANYFFSSKNSILVEPKQSDSETNQIVTSTSVTSTMPVTIPIKSIDALELTSTPVLSDVVPKKMLLHVPFTPQAPFGDWTDPRQQDGCEEASVVMAWRFINGQNLTRQEALEEITQMSEWEKEQYGNSRDTSAADTLGRLLREYYGYKGGRVEYDITRDDVKRELIAGNILIIPFDGQVLVNPNFKAPGPERHMLVVIGYDDAKQQFITNDPGTRLGQGFVYTYDNFEASFRDYETGDHEPIVGRRSAMIVVEKSS